jgi:glycerate kinase
LVGDVFTQLVQQMPVIMQQARHHERRGFGPQKGASAETVEQMENALEQFAAVIQRDLQLDVRTINGGGASGGLGAGVYALLGATLHPRYDIVMRYLELDSLLADADLVFTAEGAIDFQTPRGKVPAEVSRRAKRFNLPVIVLAGTVGKNAALNYECGIDAFTSILPAPSTLDEAIERAAEWLTDSAESVARMLLIGQRLGLRAA